MSRPYRPANGRDPLPQPYNPDFIPADPLGPRPTKLAAMVPALSEKRSTKVEPSFDETAGEVVIPLGFNNPVKEKDTINRIITQAKLKGRLRLVTIIVESEVLSEPDAYHFFFVKNKRFVRNEGKESDLRGQLVFEMRIGEKP